MGVGFGLIGAVVRENSENQDAEKNLNTRLKSQDSRNDCIISIKLRLKSLSLAKCDIHGLFALLQERAQDCEFECASRFVLLTHWRRSVIGDEQFGTNLAQVVRVAVVHAVLEAPFFQVRPGIQVADLFAVVVRYQKFVR